LALSFFIPVFAHGAVVINEVAWMGTALSATDEWIELWNDGAEDVSLSGWKLVADDGAPSVALAGDIVAGGYYLLERTDDTTVQDIAADKIYTGDLGNGGETLRLFDAAGIAVDAVSGGTDWEAIGGYNETKDTPQRQGNGTWLTGVPTPRAANTAVASAPPPDGAVAGTSTSKTSAPRKRVVTGGYKQIVFGYAGEDITGVVGAAVRFEGYAVSDKNTRLSAATYRWSFGDGGHGKGKETTHAYEEPGTYTAVLRVFSEYQKWQDAITVTVLPVAVRIAGKEAGERGYIEVHNDMETELDLSGWKLSVLYARRNVRDTTFIIPEATLIAPKSSVRFPSRITRLSFSDEDTVVLQYPSGARIPDLSPEP
ncbi:MAG TPA: lamin tail domain-containing protein, partial [Candidatus Paceibacterota bacterium]|nr:lamin tail domain-containing protein [Candidatus Paceibacterota bacterium]